MPSSSESAVRTFSPDSMRKFVNGFHSGIRFRLFLRDATGFCAAALFLGGGLVLLRRIVFTEWPRTIPAGGTVLLVILALVLAFVRASLRTPSKAKLTVWLDAASDCGGFLSASLETDCSAWADRIEMPAAPELNMTFPAAHIAALLTAGAFFAASLFINLGDAFRAGPATLDVHEDRQEIESKLDILEQEPLVPQEDVEAARETLEELVENSVSSNPARTFEGIKALQNLADSLAAEAGRSLERSLENFQKLSQTAAALANLSPDVPGRSKALEQFKQLAEQLAADDPALAEFLKQSGDNLAGGMTPDQLQSLAEQLASGSQDLKDRLEKLAQARRDQMMQQSGGQGGENGEGQGGETGFANQSDYDASQEALQQWLKENAPGASELGNAAGQGSGEGEGDGEGQGGQGDGSGTGSGGNSRGRGDALLMYSGHTEDVGDERQDMVLENNKPGQSVTISQFATEPDHETAERAKAGSLTGSGQAAEHAETRILPSHRESVRRYFNRSEQQSNQ